MKKVTALLFLFIFLLGGCGTGNHEKKSDSAQQEQRKIVIGLMPDIDSVPFLIAEYNGYFKEEGIDVTLMPFKSAIDRDAALQSGNLDGAVSDLLAVAFAKAGGFDVYATSMTDGNYRLIAGKNEDLSQGLIGLNRKEIAVSKNTIIEYVTDQILLKNKMSDSSIEKVVIPQIPIRLEMLQNGKLPAATLPEPMASIAVHHGCQYVTDSKTLGINPGVMIFTKDFIQKKEMELEAVYRAYNKAVDYLNTTEREKYIDVIIEKSGFPVESKEVLQLPEYHKAMPPRQKDVEECMNWLYKKQLMTVQYTHNDIVAEGLLK